MVIIEPMRLRKTYEESEWLTPPEAERLSGGIATGAAFRDWARQGLIDAVRLPNGRYKISRSAIESMLKTAEPEESLSFGDSLQQAG